MSRRRPQQYQDPDFSVGTPSQWVPLKANAFSGIAHHQPPGGKSSIDFSNGTAPARPQQHQQQAPSPSSGQWQTSSQAASAAVDLSYQLQLPQTGDRPPSSGRRAAPTGSYDAGYGMQQSVLGYSARGRAPYPGEQYTGNGVVSRAASSGTVGAGLDGGYAASNSSWAGATPATGYQSSSGYPAQYSSYSPEMQREIAQRQGSQRSAYDSHGYDGYGAGSDGATGVGSRDYGRSGSASSEAGYMGPPDGWAGESSQAYGGQGGAAVGMGYGQGGDRSSPAGRNAGQQTASAAHGSYSRGSPGSLAAVPKPAATPQFCPSKGAYGGKTIVQPPGGRCTLNLFG